MCVETRVTTRDAVTARFHGPERCAVGSRAWMYVLPGESALGGAEGDRGLGGDPLVEVDDGGDVC